MSDRYIIASEHGADEYTSLPRLLPQTRWKRWALAWAFWTVVALVSALYFWFGRRLSNQVVLWDWPGLILAKLTVWYCWAGVTILILKLGRFFRFERGRALRWSLTHLFFSSLIAGGFMLYYSLAMMTVRSAPFRLETFANFYSLLSSWHLSFFFLAYWAVIGIDYAIDFYKRYRERDLRAAQLEKQLTRAQLEALKAQLQPHFLFNTLHMISSLMHRDVNAADSMLAKLSDMLRLSLKNVWEQETSLREELELTKLYLEIQQTRFKDRLTVGIDVDTSLFDARAPNLLLQPLVENAIHHGVAPHSGVARIDISAARRNGELELIVEDNGPGLPDDWSMEESRIGLTNTRERLRQLYGERQSMELRTPRDGGLSVVIRFPFELSNNQLETSGGKRVED